MTVYSVDVLASKAFAIGGTARLEPFVGWSMLFIDARSGVIDATPDLRRVARRTGADRDARTRSAPPRRSTAAGDDLNANFTFPDQDVITRQRCFGGFKLKLSVLFLAAQVEYRPAGTSRDGHRAERPTAAARSRPTRWRLASTSR